MKKIIFPILSALSLSVSASAYALTMEDAMLKAYVQNPALEAERANKESTDELLPQAYSGFLPTLSAEYSRGKVKETIGLRESDNMRERRALVLSQPVFSGGSSIFQTNRANELISAARAGLIDTEQEILGAAVQTYMDVVRTDKVLDLSKNNEQVLTEQLQATDERFKLGETTRTDVAQAEARLARAKSDRIRAEGEVIAARSAYKRIVGEEPQGLFMPTSLPQTPATLDEVLKRALDNNPRLKRAEFTKEAAESDVWLSKSRLLPVASVDGRMDRQEGLSSFFGSEQDTDSLLFNVTVPLYQSGEEYSRIRQAKRTRERRNMELSDTNNATVESATKAWKDLETARSTILSTTSAVKAAKIALDGVRQEADVGSRTILDILDAEQELFTANVNLVTAQRNEVIAVYNLKAVMGEMTAENLGLPGKHYDRDAYRDKVKYRMIGF